MDYTYGTTRSYEFKSGDFDDVISKVTEALLKLEDYYPVEAVLSSTATNGKRYQSNYMTIHRHDPEMIKVRLRDPINRLMQKDLETACFAGDFSPINSTTSTLTVREKKKLGKRCPNCKKYQKTHLKRHLEACGHGKWCTTCLTLPTDLAAHKQVCDGELFPCRVCGTVLDTSDARNEHEKVCRRPDSAATGRNVRPRSDIADGPDLGNSTPHPTPSSEQSAINGLFQTISLAPPSGTGSDYEGALINLHEQMVDIIAERRGKKFYNHIASDIRDQFSRDVDNNFI
jgi:hypothetical protein